MEEEAYWHNGSDWERDGDGMEEIWIPAVARWSARHRVQCAK